MDLDLTQCENSALKEVIDWLLPEFCGKTMSVVEFYLVLEVEVILIGRIIEVPLKPPGFCVI